ncbi:SGNH/GDSL hydrolase family protein, partial [Ligilactobacillus salivarius]
YLTNVALIALFNPEENTYTPVLVSEDSNQRQYSFEILQNGLYVISTDVSTEYSPIFITKSKEENLADISMFSSIGVIGDSYASGELVFDGNYVDHYEISWGQILGRKNGIKVTNFSKGGLTTQTWLTNEHGLSLLNSSDICDLYILALGINDYSRGKEAYLGTTSDISTQGDTFYGNYSKIINAIKSKAPGSKIVISTIAYKSDLTDKYNDAIKKLATHFSIPVIDQQTEPFFSSDYYLNHMQGGHPTGPVYSGMAKAMQNLIEQSMSD